MIDHISIAVAELARAITFYDAVFQPLGIGRLWTADDAAGYGYAGRDEPFAIKQIGADAASAPNRGTHVAFAAPSRDAAISFHRAALAHGGEDDGAPALHPEYGPGYFAAFVRDPDGNRLEAVLHEGRPPSRETVVDELRTYRPADDREAAMRERLLGFVVAHAGAFDRELLVGHVTASAWIVDPVRSRALLTHHRKLGKWLQLGGHADGDPDLRAAALREAREESGLTSLRFASEAIYDLDVHPIPARPGEPAHDHYDVRFALEADPAEPLVVSAESKELAWIPLDDLERYGADESVLRLARKTAGLRMAAS